MQHSLVVQTDAAHVTDPAFAINTFGSKQPAKPVHFGAAKTQNSLETRSLGVHVFSA